MGQDEPGGTMGQDEPGGTMGQDDLGGELEECLGEGIVVPDVAGRRLKR